MFVYSAVAVGKSGSEGAESVPGLGCSRRALSSAAARRANVGGAPCDCLNRPHPLPPRAAQRTERGNRLTIVCCFRCV